jgi:transcriptional regulator with XRE-family HTH domain
MFGDRIKQLRFAKDMSQGDLAKALHVAQTTVSQWESNDRKPSIDTLSQIADYFGVSTDYILGRTDIKTEHIIKAPPELESAGVEKVAIDGRDYLTRSEVEAIRRFLQNRDSNK